MFNIGDEVMDKDGNQYLILGISPHVYHIRGTDGHELEASEYNLAKYDPPTASALAKITEKIYEVALLLHDIKNAQTDLFEKARQRT